VGQFHGAGDRRAVLDEVKRELLIHCRVDKVVRPDKDDGVAISGRSQRRLHADVAAGADAVLDDELLAEMLRQISAEQEPGNVIRAASREADDEVDRLAWIVERRGARARERENGKAKREWASKTR